MDFILSTEDINSYGFKVLTKGIDLSKFKDNALMLFNHDLNQVIGSWSNPRKKNKQLIATADFDEDDDFAMKIKGKVEKGLIKGTSIGFTVKQYHFEGDTMVVDKAELKEASVTPLPANSQAIRLYDEEGFELTEEDIVTLSINSKKNFNPMDETIKKLSEMLEVEEDKVIEAVEGLKNSFEKLSTNIESKQDLINTTRDEYETKLSEKDNEIETLSQELNTLKVDIENEKIREMITLAIEEGKILESQREEYLELAETNQELVKSIIEKAKPINTQKLTEVIETETLSDEDPRKEWDWNEWSKKDPKGLQEMMLNDEERYYALYSATFLK